MPFGLFEQLLKLFNLLIEGMPIEQRRANALIWFHLTWPIVAPLIPLEDRKAIEEAISKVKVG